MNEALSVRQERFIQLVISGESATAAYRTAYGCSQESAESAAPRLLGNVRVASAIAAANAEAAVAARVTKQDVVNGLLHEARNGDAKSRVSAWMGIAKVLGFLVDRQEVTTRAFVIEAPARAPDAKTWEAEAERLTGGGWRVPGCGAENGQF